MWRDLRFPRNPFGGAGLPFGTAQEFKMASDNESQQQDKNKEKAKSQDKRLKTKQEGEPDENAKGDVAGSGTSGSSDGSSSA